MDWSNRARKAPGSRFCRCFIFERSLENSMLAMMARLISRGFPTIALVQLDPCRERLTLACSNLSITASNDNFKLSDFKTLYLVTICDVVSGLPVRVVVRIKGNVGLTVPMVAYALFDTRLIGWRGVSSMGQRSSHCQCQIFDKNGDASVVALIYMLCCC
jgi:hypothetical protein